MEAAIIYASIYIIIGGLLLFFGVRFMKVALTILGAVIGYSLGAQLFALLGLPATLGLTLAIVTAVLVAALAFSFYKFAVLFGTALFVAGLTFTFIEVSTNSAVLALLAGLLLGFGTYMLLRWLKIVEVAFAFTTSFQGAAAVVAAVLVLLSPSRLNAVNNDSVSLIVAASGFWVLVWLVVAAIGLAVQLQEISKKPADETV